MFSRLWSRWLKSARSGSRRGAPSRRGVKLLAEILEERATPATVEPTGGGQPFDNRQPYGAMNYVIAVEGVYPPTGNEDGKPTEAFRFPNQGEIIAFAGSTAPVGYTFCVGQLLPIEDNLALFSLLGTNFGGDGISTFALPDLRGRTPVGVGTAAGLSAVTLGQQLGGEFTTLTVGQMPTHGHDLPAGGKTQNTGDGKEIELGSPRLGLNPIIDSQGEVRWMATERVPQGAAAANGRILNIAENQALHRIIGTTYGGDGQTTFQLPDLRGRVVIGYGQGLGLSVRDFGQKPGQESIFLDPPVINVPSHTHVIPDNQGVTKPAGGGQPFDIMQPSIVMDLQVALSGGAADEPAIGSIHLFASLFTPQNTSFEIAGGQPALRSSVAYAALFNVIGTTYGVPSEQEFNFPDFEGRMMVGAGHGAGLSNYVLGEHGSGQEKVTLTGAQLPSHTHGLITLSGNLFSDHNADHTQDAGEDGMAGRTVFLDSNHNGNRDDAERSTVTGAGGGFSFAGIEPGSYSLRLDSVGFETTVGADGEGTDLTLLPGDEVTGVELGVRPLAVVRPLPVDADVFWPPISDDETALVQGYYHALLGRDAEPDAIPGWIQVMRAQSGEAVIRGIVGSSEFHGQQVAAYYQVLLGRDGSAAEIDGWVRQRTQGLSSADLLTAFLTSTEFVSRSDTEQSYVENLYRVLLGREGDAAGVASWTNALTTRTAPQVIAGILDSQESHDRSLAALYAQLLHRGVDAAGQSAFGSLVGTDDGLTQTILSLLLSNEFVTKRTGVELYDTSGHTETFVTVEPGVQLEVLDWGGTGETMVLLTGLGDNAHVYDRFAYQFTDRFHVIGITRRGFGRSSKPDHGYDVHTRASDDIAVLDALGIERAVVVGHSIAGTEMSALAVAYPDRVSKLVYLDALDLASGGWSALPQPPPPPPPTDADLVSLQRFAAYSVRTDGYEKPLAELAHFVKTDLAGRVVDTVTPPDISKKIYAGLEPAAYDQIQAPALGIFNLFSPQYRLPYYEDLSGPAKVKFDDSIAALSPWNAGAIERFRSEVANSHVIELLDTNHYIFIVDEALVVREMRKFLLG